MQKQIAELRDVLERQSIRRGHFVLASGATSNYYCNTKATTLSPRGARLTGEILFELLKDRGVEAVGGLAMGATFIATAVALVSDQRGQPIYGFTVRSQQKTHGLETSIEESWHPDGKPLLSPGRRVAVVEDVVTQGGSVLKAIDAVQARGCEIALVVALVDRNAGGAERIRARGLEYSYLFRTDPNGTLITSQLTRSLAGKTSKKSAKVAKKAAAKRVAVKAAKPRKAVAKSSAREPTKAAAKELPAHHAVPKATATKSKGPAVSAKPNLLAGGNPQIAKADGDAPVQAYIAAMPGWKSDVGRRLDALIVRTVPGVRKAVKWNSPFYGVEGQGWFLDIHTFTNYVKVAFFRGTSLRPVPPGESKHEEVRYLDIHEDDELDEAQLATWIRQAAALPGWALGSDLRLSRRKSM